MSDHNLEKVLEYKGYPICMDKRHLGDNYQTGEDEYEIKLYMFIGRLRVDVTECRKRDIIQLVRKLEIMGLTDD